MDLDNLRLFAKVAELRSFTAASRALGVPKQTLSRRIAELEVALDVQLIHRTTRSLHLTEVGAAYAQHCREIVRLSEKAHRAVTDAKTEASGLLRVTADPLFGEHFLKDVLVDYAVRCPNVDVQVMLTQRRVDLLAEGIDVAIRIGHVDDAALTATRLGPARVRYCASAGYIERRGEPKTPEELVDHDCILMPVDDGPPRWPFRGDSGPVLLQVNGRMVVNSFDIAYAAMRAGLGVAMVPEFFCRQDVAEGRVVPVLDGHAPDGGAVWLVHPTHRYLVPRVRVFVDMVVSRLGLSPPWAPEDVLRQRSSAPLSERRPRAAP
jgi:DNA-binding transcriptional LysR family regulator